MSNKEIYNYGTTVYYEGDDAVQAGFGSITDCETNYLGELVMQVTLEDGRVITDVVVADFEAQTVLGNTKGPEFQLLDVWKEDVEDTGMITRDEHDLWRNFV